MKEKNFIKGKFRAITSDSISGEIKRTTPFYDNLVVSGTDTGLDLILDRLNGTNTYSLNITYLDIGTNSATPANSDTVGLTGAVARTAKASGVVSSNQITLRFFYASADLANGNYYDVRAVVDGTATLSTGQLFSRALFGSVYAKGTNEDTTIEYIYTLTN